MDVAGVFNFILTDVKNINRHNFFIVYWIYSLKEIFILLDTRLFLWKLIKSW